MMNDSGVDAMQANRDPRCRTQYRLPDGFEHCSKLKPVMEAATALDRVKAVVDVLYSPGGCPWDGKQTNESLLKNLLEETYEYVDAVETHDRANMREELGDVLLQSVFQARVCESDAEDPFDIDEVADRLVNKLITRHPHVFAADTGIDLDSAPDTTDTDNTPDTTNTADSADNGGNAKDGNASLQQESPEAVLALWEKMKQQEKHRTSVLEGISQSQGALPRAAKVVSRISKSPNADELFKAFDEMPLSKGQRDDERHAAGQSQKAEQSTLNGDATAEREKADAYANAILGIVRKARIDGIDIEAALRNRLRDVESRVADIESSSRAR